MKRQRTRFSVLIFSLHKIFPLIKAVAAGIVYQVVFFELGAFAGKILDTCPEHSPVSLRVLKIYKRAYPNSIHPITHDSKSKLKIRRLRKSIG